MRFWHLFKPGCSLWGAWMSVMTDSAMMAHVKAGAGVFAALDQSGGSTAATLQAYGIPKESWGDATEMAALIHQMRVRIISAPDFDGRKVLAAILFERTMEGQVAGQPVPHYLRSRGVAPFLKIDQGLAPEALGVQLMKPIPDLGRLLQRATALGVLGTKMRSVIRRMDRAGIAALLDQQFDLAGQIAAAGLLPILEPEVLTEAADRRATELFLVAEISRRLDAMPGQYPVMLKLTLPEQPDTYAPLAAHPRVLRVLALSGGLSRREACERLARNHGMIASFSRALLEDLRQDLDDAAFHRLLSAAISQIYAASTEKRGD